MESADDFNPRPYEESADSSVETASRSDEPGLDEADIWPAPEPPVKRKPGAPRGNKNRLEHGAYSRELEAAKKRRLKGKARRLVAETLSAVLNDQGPLDSLSLTFQFTCQRFAKRVGRLHQMERAVEHTLKLHPTIKDNPKSLSKLYEYLRPLENDALNDARVIGFQQVKGPTSLSERMKQIEQQQKEESR